MLRIKAKLSNVSSRHRLWSNGFEDSLLEAMKHFYVLRFVSVF